MTLPEQVRQVAPLPDDSLRVGEEFQSYRIAAVLGRGGMGEVYLAHEVFLDRYVALKVASVRTETDPLTQDRLRREAAAGVRVVHDNVVKVFSGGMHAGKVFVAMEYLAGGITLRELMKTEHALEAADAVTYAIQIADALRAMHTIEIHHRDLKPENVIALPGGHIKVIDFGLARVRTESLKTTKPLPIGTPHYMAPERFDDTLGLVDGRVDVYALGLMLLEMLVGAHPFELFRSERLNKQEVTMRHFTFVPPQLSELRPNLPPELSELIARMLEKRPSSRPTAEEVGRVLRRIAVEIEARRADREHRQSENERETRARALAAGTAAALTTGMTSTSPAPPPVQALPKGGTFKMAPVGSAPPPNSSTGDPPVWSKAPLGKRGTERMQTVGSSFLPDSQRWAAWAKADLEGRAAPPGASRSSAPDRPRYEPPVPNPELDTDRLSSTSHAVDDGSSAEGSIARADTRRSAFLGVLAGLGVMSAILLAFVAGRMILREEPAPSAAPGVAPAATTTSAAEQAAAPQPMPAPPAPASQRPTATASAATAATGPAKPAVTTGPLPRASTPLPPAAPTATSAPTASAKWNPSELDQPYFPARNP